MIFPPFQPSDHYGCACDTLCPYFYINNCHYNGAAAVLEKVVSVLNFPFSDFAGVRKLQPAGQWDSPDFRPGFSVFFSLLVIVCTFDYFFSDFFLFVFFCTFDQEEFFNNNAGGHSMESRGYVYIPQR